MIKRVEKAIKWQTALLFLVLLAVGAARPVKAGSQIREVKNGFKEAVFYTAAEKKAGVVFFTSVREDAAECKVVSSKTSVARVENIGNGAFLFYPKKAGTTKVTVTGKVKGKTVKCQGTVRVIKFRQPFKALRFGGKEYSQKIRSGNNRIDIKTKKARMSVRYRLKPGWEVTNAWVEQGYRKGVGLENGKSISVIQGGEAKKGRRTQIFIQLKHKETGVRIEVGITAGP